MVTWFGLISIVSVCNCLLVPSFCGNSWGNKLILNIFYTKLATGGCDGILHPALVDQVNALHEAVASLAAEPKSEESEEHILENFHSSRVIRKLVLDCSAFASTLWKMALAGKCDMWAKGHRSD